MYNHLAPKNGENARPGALNYCSQREEGELLKNYAGLLAHDTVAHKALIPVPLDYSLQQYPWLLFGLAPFDDPLLDYGLPSPDS